MCRIFPFRLSNSKIGYKVIKIPPPLYLHFSSGSPSSLTFQQLAAVAAAAAAVETLAVPTVAAATIAADLRERE